MQSFVTGFRLGVATLTIGLGLLAAGCNGSPIGDPCIPESIPAGGFDDREIYLETGSVQCRTRTCMVYELDGDPRQVQGSDTCVDPDLCVSAQELDQQVFCSCRCSAPQGSEVNTPLCDCGDGYTCVDDVVTTGGPGVRGGYCVPCIKPNDDRDPPLDPSVFDLCPTDE